MAIQTDPLTGLPGRPALDTTLKRLIDGGHSVALGLLDVDRFMEINARYGHDAGDRVLQVLSELLTEAAPDQVYRIAGDEFALVLPGLSLEQAFLRMEALRGRVQAAAERFGLPDRHEVTISIGVAQYPRDAKEPSALLNVADAALGGAKENERNQVGLPPAEEMVMKSCYYPAASLRRLKALARQRSRTESSLLREALDDLLRKHDAPREA